MEGGRTGSAAPDEDITEEETRGGLQGQAPVAELTESPRASQDFRWQLQQATHDYNTATGAIASLVRQVEVQESQLRRIHSEKETLQKKLRERENQLRAMSAKFCSLREERKHEELMATIEKENCSLRELVTEQESKLAEQKKLISELQGTVSQLQAEVLSSRCRIQKRQRVQEAMQSQAEMLQHKELQTRVALEHLTARFERYRSKIIQATFSTAGSKPPQAEVTDEELLEAVQKIINERVEFHQMLKQNGIKVPALSSSDTSTPLPTSVEGQRKAFRKGNVV